MKSEVSRPIPIPFAQRVRLAQTTLLPTVVFLGTLVAVAILWRERVGAPSMVGQADGALANVSSHQAGVLVGMRVARFQKVTTGEPIASVMIADPKLVEASLAVIRSELDVLRATLNPIAAQQRNAVNYAQLRLNWMRERAELATARVNVQLAELQLQRAQDLFNNQIASQSEFDTAKANFQGLQKQVEELGKLVVEGEESFRNLQPTNSTDISRISDEPMRAAIAAAESKLRLAEAQLSPLTLRAPIDGTVTAVYFRSGESITPGQPVVVIAADKPMRIVGYLRQPISREPSPGTAVQIRTRTARREVGTGRIVDVGGQLEPLPLALQSPLKIAGAELALPVNISLPTTMNLRPGELVDISLLPTTE